MVEAGNFYIYKCGGEDIASATEGKEKVRSTTASPFLLFYSILLVVPLADPSRDTADSEPGKLSLKGSAPWNKGRGRRGLYAFCVLTSLHIYFLSLAFFALFCPPALQTTSKTDLCPFCKQAADSKILNM